MQSIIKDINLAPEGHYKINWVKNFMPCVNALNEELSRTKPLLGKRIVVTMHLEAKTAYLGVVLKNAGAEVIMTGSNPLSTQDDVVAALVDQGITVFAKYNCTDEEYHDYLHKALDMKPNMIVDDGGDLVSLLHGERSEQAKEIWGGSEETTTGVIRLKALEAEARLQFPMIAVNDAYCKYLFDNRYGTGQSTWDGIMRTTNLTVVGKTVVVAGYGWCGRGAAMRAKGLGANVIVTEVNPIKAIEAVFDGFRVMPMEEAAALGDIFVTLTGCKDVIRKEHMLKMKDGAIMANAGHFDVEINKIHLNEIAVSKGVVRKNIEGFELANGNRIYLLAEGRLVNLAAGDGHPTEIMDLSFALQAIAVLEIAKNHDKMENKVYNITDEMNEKVAGIKLRSMGIAIDSLSDEQYQYLHQA